jgi:isocitrate dehydrogenase kinase/phosphatase
MAAESPPLALASLVHAGFESYQAQFQLVTRRAQARFVGRDWIGAQRDAHERLGLFSQFSDWVVREVYRELDGKQAEPWIWAEARTGYLALATRRDDAELALTFFNSVARRVLRTVGTGAEVSFVRNDFAGITAPPASQAARRHPAGPGGLVQLLGDVLRGLPFADAFADLEEDAALAAASLARDLEKQAPGGVAVEALELVPAPFYRNKGAYLVGRLLAGELEIPVVLALVHPPEGVRLDAVLSSPQEASVVFSFTRSYFHVELGCAAALVAFLAELMPLKPVEELYTAIGCNKHGKTLLFHALVRQLEDPEARFEIAEGEPGLVMVVFALPTFNVVFKIIRDHFGAPKTTTREEVEGKYHLVFVHDRVGRLADAQAFRNLSFRKDRFSAELLDELRREAAGSVRIDGDRIIVRHLYTERRVTPLNLYLRQASPAQARDAILDYGNAIRDLAAANIFTGDMLLKNFGVTRQGRVIFYDYDELCLLTDVHIRDLPVAKDDSDEWGAEPWFSVSEGDVFPEEFRHFLVIPGPLGDAFLSAHADLLTPEFWRRMQELAREGELADVFPYRAERRLRDVGMGGCGD